ncbi:MAG TPA: protein translocase subunit SecD [Chloroflexi bacterium]|nr:protein translocase subunit SecD [Chloroflexota bacterium]
MPLFLMVWLVVSFLTLGALAVIRPNRHVTWLVIIILLTAFAVWVSLPDNPGIHIDTNGDGEYEINKEIAIRQGLDLAGGVKVLLEADLPEGETPPPGAMNEVRRIVEARIDSLGALEPVIQLQGERRLIVELPGYEDPESAVELIKNTALLEFVELPAPLPPGTPIKTDYGQTEETDTGAEGTGEEDNGPVYHTVMTGEILQSADVTISSQFGTPVVAFTLTPEGSELFGEYTSNHVGDILGIVLDGVVISSPRISSAITGGQGVIEGDFDLETATRLATQLRYGALPIPLRVDSTSTVGPTLGQVSVQQSIRAGMIGVAVVLLFMLIYYRLPGVAAALALIIFALINFAIYKLVPVTMTLPAITGFLISVGTAVDGNILIFERMKEELRAGKGVMAAVKAGFERAFPSIRDSNLSTIIICAVLYAFGTSFGAGAVRGFAVTLALGLVVNLFTAIIVTRTFLHFIMLPISEEALAQRRWVMGL